MQLQPRTKRQALEHVLSEFNAGRLGAMGGFGCAYESSDGKHCAVGCLFTPKQIAWIKDHNLNHSGVSTLIDVVGKQNIEFMTGMSYFALTDLQSMHDKWASKGALDDEFREFLEYQLANNCKD